MSVDDIEQMAKENEKIVNQIFDLFKGKSYGYVKETLQDCLIDLEDMAKVP